MCAFLVVSASWPLVVCSFMNDEGRVELIHINLSVVTSGCVLHALSVFGLFNCFSATVIVLLEQKGCLISISSRNC